MVTRRKPAKGRIGTVQRFDGLQNELVDVRSDLKSVIRIFRLLMWPTFILLAVFILYAHVKLTSMEQQLLTRIEERLAKTDALLRGAEERRMAQLERKLDERNREIAAINRRVEAKAVEIATLNQRLDARTQELGALVANIEAIQAGREEINPETEEQAPVPALQQVPPNRKVDMEVGAWLNRDPEGYFTVEGLSQRVERGETRELRVTFSELASYGSSDCLRVLVYRVRRDRKLVPFKDEYFAIQGRINRLPIDFDIEEGKYFVKVGTLSRAGDAYFYRAVREELVVN